MFIWGYNTWDGRSLMQAPRARHIDGSMQANGHWFIDMFLWLQNLLGIGNKTAEEKVVEIVPEPTIPKEEETVTPPPPPENTMKTTVTHPSNSTPIPEKTVKIEYRTTYKINSNGDTIESTCAPIIIK